MDIRYVNWGIGNNFGKYIELNKNLKLYPQLHDAILKHELSHTDKFIAVKDFKLDLNEDKKIGAFDILRFMFWHPKALTQLLPLYWTRKKGFVYDINLTIMYIILIVLLSSSVIIGLSL